MTYQTDLMIQVREQCKMNPESHDQGGYEGEGSCGTTRCVAGWAIFLATGKSVHTACRDADFVTASELGAHLLGLNYLEANDLFYEMDEDQALFMLDELIEKGKNQP
ncbi:hypothetical protein ACFWPU_00750 [Streptomyces sp. NPDC058471]|uniref:hypothetical protein n=1 Tax=Streptomyces sp. NPDC058471 TaxID=3346516 RepID=UPI0036563789